MQNVRDLIATLKRPGTSLLISSNVIQGQDLPVPADRAAPRRVVDVNEFAIYLADGKVMPIQCQAQYEFNGAPDRFVAKIGPAVITYHIIQGNA